MSSLDSVLFIGFGGPEAPEQVMPFLENVVRGRNVPPERLAEVAHHYEEIGGRSPYNELALRQASALERRLSERGRPLPVYVGMRNWHPYLSETIRRMRDEGRQCAAGVILAAHRSSTSLERYRLDVSRAMEEAGGTGFEVRYLEPWFDHPLFIEAAAQRIEEVISWRRGSWPPGVPLVLTAHSIPLAMAQGSPYVADLLASCRGIAGLLGAQDWRLAYQSRSGDGRVPWLEPDVNEVLRNLAGQGVTEVVVQPVGFLQDHVEVLYDLDIEARATAADLAIRLHRAGTVGDHPCFIDLLAQRVEELGEADQLDDMRDLAGA